MSPEEFERKLQRQPLREVPSAWREEILTAARAAQPDHGPRTTDHGLLEWLRACLQPPRLAWASLGAVWAVILGLNFTARETESSQMAAAPPPTEMREAMRQKQLLLSELTGRTETAAVERREEFVPRPRSERRDEWGMA